MTEATTLYYVIDVRTKARMGKPLAFRAACRKRDRLDAAYGAVRYSVVRVEA